ncbi:MAG: class I SAM-dependent methyltransferase [Devosia sp.]
MKKILSRLAQRFRSYGKSNQQVFDQIYRAKTWKGPGEISSGLGSLPNNSQQYEDAVVAYVQDHGIRTIVDVGCGDFQVSERILRRLPDIVHYTGVDVSTVAIEHNQRKFANERVSFQVLDAASAPLPSGDLVLVREVLQHLPNADISKILSKLDEFPHALITNTVHTDARKKNFDIGAGSASRAGLGGGLWLDLPPFSRKVKPILIVVHDSHPTEIQTVLMTS